LTDYVIINGVQAAAVKKERELQKKLLKKERKTFRTVMKVLYISVAFVSDLKFAFTD